MTSRRLTKDDVGKRLLVDRWEHGSMGGPTEVVVVEAAKKFVKLRYLSGSESWCDLEEYWVHEELEPNK